MSIVKSIFGSSLAFFAALAALSLVLIDYGKLGDRLMVRTLNDHTPQDFSYFLRIVEGDSRLDTDRHEMEQHAQYYETILKYFPQWAEAHMLLGVSYYHLGKKKEALKELEKAAVLNPHFFWIQYNLGALFYESGEYGRSAQILERARHLQPQVVLMVMKNSPVYQRLLSGVTNFGEIAMAKMRSGYSECYRLLVLSYLRSGDHAKAIQLSREALDQGLDHKELFYYFAAVASYEAKQYSISMSLLKEALDTDKTLVPAYDYLAKNLETLGERKKAREIRAAGEQMAQAGTHRAPEDDEILLKVF
jgi:tetratricopeptide (TPR) repeat protein